MTAFDNAAPWSARWLSVVRIGAGLLFFQHGAEKLWGFAGARAVGVNFTTLFGIAGLLEVGGGALLVLGLFTRPTAFILCGEMAVAYFTRWAPRGFWPINNGGEEAVIFCFLYLWLVTAGAGPWSLDRLLGWAAGSWESYGRSVLRIILAFTFSLHGYRHVFNAFPGFSGRRGIPIAVDALPPVFGYLEIAGGILLFLGLLARPTAAILSCELLAAYFYSAAPRAIWPIRNGGNEVLLYFLAFVYLALSGAGAWSLDQLQRKRADVQPSEGNLWPEKSRST